MRKLLAPCAAFLLLAAHLGQTKAQAPAAHLGSVVIFIRYENPDVAGTEAAAIIVDAPFTCPAGHPHEGGECAHLRFLTRNPGDPENGSPVQWDACLGTCAGYVNTGMDWRSSVWHDPTGKTLRSWRLAEGED